MKKAFERQYSLDVPKLRMGHNEEKFIVKSDFLENFETSYISDCDVEATVEVNKYLSHLDAKFHLKGWVEVECDRCLELIKIPIESNHRVIYSFEDKMEETDDMEIIYVSESEPYISLVQDLYDFIGIAIPFRNVHEDIGEQCDPRVMQYITGESDL